MRPLRIGLPRTNASFRFLLSESNRQIQKRQDFLESVNLYPVWRAGTRAVERRRLGSIGRRFYRKSLVFLEGQDRVVVV